MRTGATDRALAYTGAPVRLNELFDVVFRWAHLIAGIMWIGNSMLFNWLDRNLEHHGRLSPLSQGKLFMVHSGAISGFTQMFSGRAAYIQTGVLIGTIMTGNVWLCILPSQRSLIAATEAGRPQDPVLSLRAKQRSIHNNYLTFPLLFMMLSNHFPSAYGHHLNWLVLIAVMVGGAGVRHFMNVRYRGEGRQMIPIAWLTPAAIMAAIAVGGLVLITRVSAAPDVDVTYPVGFARAQEIIVKRCVPCHSTPPTDPVFPAPPYHLVFD